MSFFHVESYQISTTGFAGTTNDEDHFKKNAIEKKFVLQRVRELCGEPPVGSRLQWKGYEHDFGVYYELTIFYPPSIEDKAIKWINDVEAQDWEKEQQKLEDIWEIENFGQLEKDNLIFDALETDE